jgi:hypothetical protein
MASEIANLIDPTGICSRSLANPPIICILLILNVAKLHFGDLTPYSQVEHTLTRRWFEKRLTFSTSLEKWIDPNLQEAQGRSLGTPPPLLSGFVTTTVSTTTTTSTTTMSTTTMPRHVNTSRRHSQFSFPRMYWDPCHILFNHTAEAIKNLNVSMQTPGMREAQIEYIEWLKAVQLFYSFEGCGTNGYPVTDPPDLPYVQPVFEAYYLTSLFVNVMYDWYNITPAVSINQHL